jgi:4-hydroxy-4-methyl-2-oxoglutarate aldolase
MEAPDDPALLERFEGLRVADVRDGLDAAGYHAIGSMAPSMRPLFRTRAFGIARTARYLPYQGRVPERTGADYLEWSGWYYGNVCTYPWMERIVPGDFVVIDQSGVNAGLMGSENTLAALKRGVRGFASNGGVRDTDEVILQKVPFWAEFVAQSMVQSRLEFDAMNVSVCVGGQTVKPGDLVVADGDGVIVVPRALALEVAGFAHDEHERDMKNRRRHYDDLGRPPDGTVR